MMPKTTKMGKVHKTATNPEQPNIKGPKGDGPRPIVTRPNSPLSTENRRLINSPKGGERTSSTFKAPRKDHSSDPSECGYTKPGKL